MIVAQGIASGEFREVDPRFVYLSVVSACEGLLDARYAMVLAYDTHEITREIRHAYIAYVTELVLGGLQPGPGIA